MCKNSSIATLLPLAVILLSGCLAIEEESRVQTSTDVKTYSWSVNAPVKGVIAHMHVQTVEQGDAVAIAGYLAPTEKGKDYLDEERPPKSYDADHTYSTANGEYNGFTLPLRLNYLAQQRYQQIAELNNLAQDIRSREKALLALANDCYDGFNKLHIAKDKDYDFSNLDTQVEIKFAGKKFCNQRGKVQDEIEKRERDLLTKKISHKKPKGSCSQENLPTAGSTYNPVLNPLDAPPMPELNFDNKAAQDEQFVQLAEAAARLKWARLQLARALLSLYQPQQMEFFYFIGDTEEHLNVTVFTDDCQDSSLSYKLRTTSKKHANEFTLGHVKFDKDLNLSGMTLSLKPRGGIINSKAQLTFKPCSASNRCPQPEFN